MIHPAARKIAGLCAFLLIAVCLAPPVAAAGAGGFFPYPVHKKTLANGLDVVVIETPEFKDVLSFNVLILAGSRNEVEKGRTGLAHLFEHMAFRHRFEDPKLSYPGRMESLGTFDNGWTSFDVTYYTPLTFTSNLQELVAIQADRFASMDFSERIYRTEAGAVLGEYRRIASDPSLRMEEVQCDLVYGTAHGYGHTTMGYMDDVKDMPNSFASGKAFYETFYRPNNAAVVVAGDVRAPEVLSAVEGTFGAWKMGKIPGLPAVKPIGGPRRSHVDWDSDVPPRISFAYLVGPFRPGTAEAAVLSVLPELLAGKTAPLYQKLRSEKRTATDFSAGGRSAQGFDPRPLEASVRLDAEAFKRSGKALFDDVEGDLAEGFGALKAFSKKPGAAGTLAAIRSKLRNDMLASLRSPQSIASTYAWFYRFGRDPRVMDVLAESLEKITAEDVDRFAATHFVPGNLVVVTMAPRKAPADGQSAPGGPSSTGGSSSGGAGEASPAAPALPSPAPQAPAPDQRPAGPQIVTLESPSPLVSIKILVRAGSTSDPPGKEGLAALTADALIDGGFGDPAHPVTKEHLAEITQPWGGGARPSAQVASDTTTIHLTVPADVLPRFLDGVLRPLFARPLFLEAEVERIQKEMAAGVPTIRFEDLEELGLAAIDEFVLEGTPYEHPPYGTEDSIPGLSREDCLRFFHAHYRPENIILGISRSDPKTVDAIAAAVRGLSAQSPGEAGDTVPVPDPAEAPAARPAPFTLRRAVVIEQPNAPAASVHLAFPFAIDRAHPDYWPLLVANTWLGTHRDSFGRLYEAIRQERGYNYGDYSYLEHWYGRTGSLFQTFCQPRRTQYFSIWLRPVQHEYAAHALKAASWELERLVREGLTEEQVAAAKIKARVIYLNLAETVDRLLGARIEDRFLGSPRGFLDSYLESLGKVTTAEVNGALKRHLQPEGIKFLVVTDSKHAADLAQALREDRPAWGKGPEEYEIGEVRLPDGRTAWQVPQEKLGTLRLDAVWAHHPLRIAEVRLAPVTALFKSGKFIAVER